MKPAYLGLVAAAVFFGISFTPSLLPRHWLAQALATGVVATVAYAVGTLLSHLWRSLVSWEPSLRAKRQAWLALAVGGPSFLIVSWALGLYDQRRLHSIVEMPPPSTLGYIAAPLVAAALAVVLVLLGRVIRLAARRVGRWLGRWLPARAAGILGGLIVGVIVIGLIDGFVIDRFFEAADETFRVSDRIVEDPHTPPSSHLRSGSEESLVAWEDLGSKGRAFVVGGPAQADLAAFHGGPVPEPIRVYAGLESDETIEGRSKLVLAELDRTGAFDRAVLCVITTTGTGWVDPEAATALEYIWGGDTALAALQYSYLPSWISFLVDSARAREAGTVFFNEIYEHWAALPENDRPLLLVFGESLGADGAEAAFSGVADMRNRTDGVMLVGPPNFSELWEQFTQGREAGTPERLPVYEGGETVRFASAPEQLRQVDDTWERPRVLYLQYASDPVVWWSPRLIWRRPDWLTEPRGEGVLPSVRWYPGVTFVQVTVDMIRGIQVPPGHGHNYALLMADGWAAVASPPDWSPSDTQRLRDVLAEIEQTSDSSLSS